MSDWSYVIIAYIVAWGGVTVYAVALARRVTQARRLERRLREMAASNATEAHAWPGEADGRAPLAAGRQAEGDRSACDVPPAP